MIYNTTNYQIMLVIFVHPESFTTPLQQALYGSILTLEVICILLTIFFSWIFGLVVIAKATFHINLMRLILVMGSTHYIQQFARIFLILYSLNIIRLTEGPIDYLAIACSFLRVYICICAITTITSSVFERIFATIYIKDYEQKPRQHIWIGLTLLSVLINVYVTMTFMLEGAQDYAPVALKCILPPLSLGILALIAFIILFRSNVRNLNLLKATFDRRRYSLSIRFQLQENVRALHMIELAVIFSSIANLFASALMLVSFIYFGIESKEGQMILALFDLFVALYAVILQSIGIYSIKEWRVEYFRIFRKVFLCGKLASAVTPAKRVLALDVNAETEEYFRQLKTFWRE